MCLVFTKVEKMYLVNQTKKKQRPCCDFEWKIYFISVELQPPLDDHLADIVDDEWRQDQLPHEQIWVPSEKLPDPEADNGDSHLTLLEQVKDRILFLFLQSIAYLFPFIFYQILGTTMDRFIVI